MAIEITVPRLGWSMEEGVFSAWLKGNGEKVVAGEMLFGVESHKVTMDAHPLEPWTPHLPPNLPNRRADAPQLVHLPNQSKAASYTDMAVKLAAIALQSHPSLAGRWDGDRIILPDAIHIGIAVDTPHGLLVPVIRNVPELSLLQVAQRCSERS